MSRMITGALRALRVASAGCGEVLATRSRQARNGEPTREGATCMDCRGGWCSGASSADMINMKFTDIQRGSHLEVLPIMRNLD
jgi:hypothetical protein